MPLFLLLLCLISDVAWPFELEGWPGEGVPQLVAIATTLPLHYGPSEKSKIIKKWLVKRGEKIPFEESRVVTEKSGRWQFRKDEELSVSEFGKVSRLARSTYKHQGRPASLQVKKGEVLEVLQKRADDSYFVRRDGMVYSLVTTKKDAAFRVLNVPKTQWWIRVLVDGKPGWLPVLPKLMKEASRDL